MRHRFLKNVLFWFCIQSDLQRGGARVRGWGVGCCVCPRVSVRACIHSFYFFYFFFPCHNPSTSSSPCFAPKAVYARWGDGALYKFQCCLPPNVVRGKQSFQRWRGDQSDLPSSPATCVMCLLACRSYVLQVGKVHNPPHLIQVHGLPCERADESDASQQLQFCECARRALNKRRCRHCLNLCVLHFTSKVYRFEREKQHSLLAYSDSTTRRLSMKAWLHLRGKVTSVLHEGIQRFCLLYHARTAGCKK